ncbi:MAG: hypothetical protein M3Y45_06500, partial [Actinomycetota bacterium]|nr:hypothetical protein [Actinomycetota bacterium]
IQEAERYAGRIVVVAEGESVFSGTADQLRLAVESGAGEPGSSGPGDLESSFQAFLNKAGH